MDIYEKLLAGETSLSLVGLGYVGMPIAVAFAKRVPVIGFDLNERKIRLYQEGKDPTNEVGDEAIRQTSVVFTTDETMLRKASFHVVAVPTPINQDKTPDLTPVISASEIVGRNLKKGDIVVYESTVYPGVTEDICLPILERESGLKGGTDFKIGYSPERINPGDKVNRLETITKIVSGMDEETLEEIARVYELVIEAGVYRASTIKVAEAAKVVENSQRDINIAFMNELAMAFDRMDIDTAEVVDAMNTKWNSLGFRPGLVGGHCIGVDPYYFVYEAEKLGYHSQIVLAGRQVNDGMGAFIVSSIIRQLALAKKRISDARVFILGITFKENCPDTRNSKVEDILRGLSEYGVEPVVVDPAADAAEARQQYGVELQPLSAVKDADCIVLAVAHDVFKEIGKAELDKMFAPCSAGECVLIDIKSMFLHNKAIRDAYQYWAL